jgi:NADH-quinone oxidoreductase subunit A
MLGKIIYFIFYDYSLYFVTYVDDYILVLMLVISSLLLTCLLIGVSYFLVFQFREEEKISSYECGFQPFEDTRQKFDIKYYLVAILFIVFDLEIMFMVPWTQVFQYVYVFGTFWLFFFLFILTVGFIYEWNKGALSWS